MGTPVRSGSTSVMPSPSGVSAQSRFDGTKVSITPEYSNQTGVSLGVALATMLGDQAAIGILLTAGADKREYLLNAGFKIDERQRFIISAGQLKQFLDYAFASGTEKTEMTQNSGGISYQLQLGNEFLRYLEANGYLSKTASRDLADKTFAIDGATLYELWNDPRRIAGGQVSGLQGKLGFSPIDGSTVKVSLGYEHLSYDLLAGKDSINRPTGGLEWQQKIGHGYQLKLGAETFAAQQRYTIGIDRNIADGTAGRHNLGLNLIGLQGRDGLGNDNQFQLTYSYIFGAGNNGTLGNPNPANRMASGNNPQQSNPTGATFGGNLLDQVAMRPSYLPGQVLAKIDKTALPIRLIAVDKTALPAGASISNATGDITVPLGIAVTGIASITRNLAAFANSGQFSLTGNNLLIRPSLIVQPAAGITDTYVVTLNNQGGGTTLATISVSHGSVKIDRIVITTSTGDTTAPTTTAAPSISVAATASTASVSQTINEAGTGYYLVQAAATAAPTVAAVKAGTSFAMTANTPAVVNLTGLTASTAYKYYFVAKDAVNNDQAAVSAGLAITTTAASLPAGYISQGWLTWMPNNIGPWSYLWFPGATDWNTANTYCTSTTINGQTGWRLPTQTELSSLYRSGALAGQGWAGNGTWSSTPYRVGSHYALDFSGGSNVVGLSDGANHINVTCVR